MLRSALVCGVVVVVLVGFSCFFVELRPLLSSRFEICESWSSPSLFLNLPGWRWGSITQNPLVAVSRPLHSGVCETRQDIGLPVLHSEISDSGLLRTRGDQQYHKQFLNEPRVIERVDALCFFVFSAFVHLCDNFHTRTWHVGVRNSASV